MGLGPEVAGRRGATLPGRREPDTGSGVSGPVLNSRLRANIKRGIPEPSERPRRGRISMRRRSAHSRRRKAMIESWGSRTRVPRREPVKAGNAIKHQPEHGCGVDDEALHRAAMLPGA